MRVRFNLDDTSSPVHGLDLPIATALDLTLNDVGELLHALGWRLNQFREYQNRMTIAALQRQAESRGVVIEHPVEVSSEDEIIQEKLLVFATLRAAGHKVSWAKVGDLKPREARLVVEVGDGLSGADEAADEGEDEADAEDPTGAPTDSVLAVGAESSDPTPGLL
jgi:hypothetical protein